MSVRTLHEIEASIDRLNVHDQARLLQYLAPKVASAMLSTEDSQVSQDPATAWARYREVADSLAATSVPGAASLTESISEMRR